MTQRRDRQAMTPSDHAAAHERLEARISERVDLSNQLLSDKVDASNEAILGALKSLQADVRSGQIDRAEIKSRLAELELAVGENRDAGGLLRERLVALELGARMATTEAMIDAAPVAAAEAAKKAPAEVWSSLSRVQKLVAVIAGCAAVLTGCAGTLSAIERLSKAGWAGVSTAWHHAKKTSD